MNKKITIIGSGNVGFHLAQELFSFGHIICQVYSRKKEKADLLADLSIADRARKCGTWLVDMATTVYTIAERRNDFFLLHGVTAAWALKQLLPCLKSHEDITTTVTSFLTTLIAVYIVRDCHPLNVEHLQGPDVTESWEDIVKCTLSPPEKDEHYYKLVQVCQYMSNECEENEQLYKKAAIDVALNNPLLVRI